MGCTYSKHVLGVFGGLFTFVSGVVAVFFLSLTLTPEPVAITVPALPVDATPEITQSSPVIERAADELGCWGDEVIEFGPIQIAPSRIFRSKCSMLYLADVEGNSLWQSSAGAPLTGQPIVIGSTLIVIGYDLTLKGFDVESGIERWQYTVNGRASFVQLAKYKDDRYFVVLDMSGYDDAFMLCAEKNDYNDTSSCGRTTPDELWLLRGGENLDQWEIPAGAGVENRKEKAFVVYKQNGKRRGFQIHPN